MKRVKAQLISRLGFCVLVLATMGQFADCLIPQDDYEVNDLNGDEAIELVLVASEGRSAAAYQTPDNKLKVACWTPDDPRASVLSDKFPTLTLTD